MSELIPNVKSAIAAFALICAICAASSSAFAMNVFCENCSTIITQLLEYITSIEDLSTAVSQYDELVTHTMQNVDMIKNQIDQYENMLKNTASLTPTIKFKLIETLRSTVSKFKDIGMYYNDITAMRGIFEAVFPDYGELIEGIVSKSPVNERIANYQRHYEEWSGEVEKSLKETFGMSGQQLNDLIDAGEFESQMIDLLREPKGQKEALDAANQLAGMQLDESRNLRALLASHIQALSQKAMKEESVETIREKERTEFFKNDQDAAPINLPTGW